MSKIDQIKQHYNLQPHPEGGWFIQTYKCKERIYSKALPGRFRGDRSFSTAIYYLLGEGDFSAFHKIKSDECWHFYSGDPLLIYIIHQSGELEIISLGNEFEHGQRFQYVVPGNCWFASRPAPGSEYCFVGCTVAPGFEFEDLELADPLKLVEQYPQHEAIIKELCR